MNPSIELNSANFQGDRKDCLKTLASILIPAWFLVILAASLEGAFDTKQGPPILLGMAAILPVAIFGILYRRAPLFREIVSSADLRVLTWIHTWRIAGIVFLIEYARGVLPGTFALSAGLGDILMGVTAPFIAWFISSRKTFPKTLFILWNLLGLLDLIVAVTLGVLSSASPVGVLAKDVTTQAMGQFPLTLIPTFFVPLLAILHLISISRARRLDATSN